MTAVARAVAVEVLRGAGLGTALLLVVSTAVAAARVLLQSAALPGVEGLLVVALGLLPSMAVVALPAGLLLGSAVAGRQWAESGDWVGYQSVGLGGRRLVGTLVLLGILVGSCLLVCTHALEPWGKSRVRQALQVAAGDLNLRPGQPLIVGDVLLHADRAAGGRYEDVFLAGADSVVAAETGVFGEGAVLTLVNGTARGLGEEGWALSFGRLQWPLEVGLLRRELGERSTPDLFALVGQMRSDGSTAQAERLALYRRTVLPLSLPLFCLVGFPLGLRRVRPVGVAAGVVLVWWVLQRFCDHALHWLGPILACLVPPVALMLLTAWIWAHWWGR